MTHSFQTYRYCQCNLIYLQHGKNLVYLWNEIPNIWQWLLLTSHYLTISIWSFCWIAIFMLHHWKNNWRKCNIADWKNKRYIFSFDILWNLGMILNMIKANHNLFYPFICMFDKKFVLGCIFLGIYWIHWLRSTVICRTIIGVFFGFLLLLQF